MFVSLARSNAVASRRFSGEGRAQVASMLGVNFMCGWGELPKVGQE